MTDGFCVLSCIYTCALCPRQRLLVVPGENTAMILWSGIQLNVTGKLKNPHTCTHTLVCKQKSCLTYTVWLDLRQRSNSLICMSYPSFNNRRSRVQDALHLPQCRNNKKITSHHCRHWVTWRRTQKGMWWKCPTAHSSALQWFTPLKIFSTHQVYKRQNDNECHLHWLVQTYKYI